MQWFVKRLAEPSSYAGLSGVIAALSVMFSTGQTSSGLIAAALAGMAAFVAGEKGPR